MNFIIGDRVKRKTGSKITGTIKKQYQEDKWEVAKDGVKYLHASKGDYAVHFDNTLDDNTIVLAWSELDKV